MNIYELIGDTDAIITAAMTHPGLAPKRKPTIEAAMKAVSAEIERRVMMHFAQSFQAALQEAFDNFELENGEYGDCDVASTDDYESGVDDVVEKLLEPLHEVLSQDWLGKNTIDTRLWEKDAISKLAQSVGKEAFKQISYGKTPNQILSNAGIVQGDVEVYFSAHMAPKTQQEEKVMAEVMELSLEGVCAIIRAHVGREYDVLEVYGDIELAVDDDEILAGGAAARLGVSKEGLEVLQMAALEYGEETVDKIAALVEAANPDVAVTIVTEPKQPTAPATPTTVSQEHGEHVDADVLTLLKEHGGAKDTEMSAALGVSRGTYNNWINGKTAFAPSDEQRGILRAQIVKNANGLLSALALLDGTEAEEVY